MLGQTSQVPHSKTRVRGLAAALAPVFVLAGAVAVLNPGAQLEQGLAAAAATEARLMAEASPAAGSATTSIASRVVEEGSEAFWLTRAPESDNVARVTWTAPVAAGDRVVVIFGAYDREIIDVISVEEVRTSATRIDTSVGKSIRYTVTGRRLADPDAAPVRLTVDAEGRGLTMVNGERDRAL